MFILSPGTPDPNVRILTVIIEATIVRFLYRRPLASKKLYPFDNGDPNDETFN